MMLHPQRMGCTNPTDRTDRSDRAHQRERER